MALENGFLKSGLKSDIMGIDLPEDWPELEPLLFYKVGVDLYDFNPVVPGCATVHQGLLHCCLPGGVISAWIDAGFECINGLELCVAGGFTAQRLKTIEGPFDDQPACQAAI